MFSQAGVSWFHSTNDLTLAPSLAHMSFCLDPDSAWEMVQDNLQIYYCILLETKPTKTNNKKPQTNKNIEALTPGEAWL